jgi:hypothetical protein
MVQARLILETAVGQGGAGFQPAARTGKMPVPPNGIRFLGGHHERFSLLQHASDSCGPAQ